MNSLTQAETDAAFLALLAASPGFYAFSTDTAPRAKELLDRVVSLHGSHRRLSARAGMKEFIEYWGGDLKLHEILHVDGFGGGNAITVESLLVRGHPLVTSMSMSRGHQSVLMSNIALAEFRDCYSRVKTKPATYTEKIVASPVGVGYSLIGRSPYLEFVGLDWFCLKKTTEINSLRRLLLRHKIKVIPEHGSPVDVLRIQANSRNSAFAVETPNGLIHGVDEKSLIFGLNSGWAGYDTLKYVADNFRRQSYWKLRNEPIDEYRYRGALHIYSADTAVVIDQHIYGQLLPHNIVVQFQSEKEKRQFIAGHGEVQSGIFHPAFAALYLKRPLEPRHCWGLTPCAFYYTLADAQSGGHKWRTLYSPNFPKIE